MKSLNNVHGQEAALSHTLKLLNNMPLLGEACLHYTKLFVDQHEKKFRQQHCLLEPYIKKAFAHLHQCLRVCVLGQFRSAQQHSTLRLLYSGADLEAWLRAKLPSKRDPTQGAFASAIKSKRRQCKPLSTLIKDKLLVDPIQPLCQVL
jgi:hypothetical protein